MLSSCFQAPQPPGEMSENAHLLMRGDAVECIATAVVVLRLIANVSVRSEAYGRRLVAAES